MRPTARIGVLCSLALAAGAFSQVFEVSWFTIDAGGGDSSVVMPSGAVVTVFGTIGQPDAGPAMSWGTITVRGGFWAGVADAVPARCDPDYNRDGVADQDDVAFLVNVIAGGDNPTGRDPDFDRNGVADQDDYGALVDVIAGGACP